MNRIGIIVLLAIVCACGVDHSPDAPGDGGHDAPATDAPSETIVIEDAPVDVLPDREQDAPVDVAVDHHQDTGLDAETDVGSDAPPTCACSADFNGDGVVGIPDVNILRSCTVAELSSICDANCDGAYDPCDREVFACQFGTTPDPRCCDVCTFECFPEHTESCGLGGMRACNADGRWGPCEGSCACDADVNDTGYVTATDLSRVRACMGMAPSDLCAGSDVDCDGDVDECDLEDVRCQASGPDATCCERATDCLVD